MQVLLGHGVVTPPDAPLLPISSAFVPLYEFKCGRCGERFEALTAPDGEAECPACGAGQPQRVYSPISRPLKFGLRGAAARRSDSLRRAREERRREERGSREERRREGRGGG